MTSIELIFQSLVSMNVAVVCIFEIGDYHIHCITACALGCMNTSMALALGVCLLLSFVIVICCAWL